MIFEMHRRNMASNTKKPLIIFTAQQVKSIGSKKVGFTQISLTKHQ